tara:strand:+ start:6638 stop:7084 length:447 start_codon:yes stop_codon:yes gene_type:complete
MFKAAKAENERKREIEAASRREAEDLGVRHHKEYLSKFRDAILPEIKALGIALNRNGFDATPEITERTIDRMPRAPSSEIKLSISVESSTHRGVASISADFVDGKGNFMLKRAEHDYIVSGEVNLDDDPALLVSEFRGVAKKMIEKIA